MNRVCLSLTLSLILVLDSFGFSLPHCRMASHQSMKPASVASAAAIGEAASFAEALNPDGTLRATKGSFNAKGYRMDLMLGGVPRFVAAQAGCSGWDTQFTLPNGVGNTILALAVSGNDIYVGGDFTVAGNIGANRVAKFNTQTNTWSALGTGGGNGVNDIVLALAVSGSDLYVGGGFTTANVGGAAVSANRVAKVNPATGVWSALGNDGGNGVNDQVNALAVIGSDLYVGGGFTTANVDGMVVSANRVAKVNPATGVWSALGTGGGNGVDSTVNALAVIGSDLYVGGFFTTANVDGASVSANRVAKVNSATGAWSALGMGDGNGVDNFVGALAVIGSDLYVGGSFTTANVGGAELSANNVARVNPATGVWSALGTGGGNGVDFSVFALAVIGSDLYAAGDFTMAHVGSAAVNANYVAKVNPATGEWSALGTGGGNGVNNGVRALAVIGSDLYVGGSFTTVNVGGAVVNANRVAKVNPATGAWSVLGTGGGNGMNGFVYALAVSGNDIYAGGDFTAAGNISANRLAKFNTLTNTWSAIGTGGGDGVNSAVNSLAVIGSDLYVGGSFTEANVGGAAVSANYVAKVNPATGVWSTLGTGGGNGVNDIVLALAVIGSDLFVGGNFTAANVGGAELNANYVAKVNPATGAWSALGTGGGNGVDFFVIALSAAGGDLYVGGSFTTANVGGTMVSTNNVAKVNPATGVWSALGAGGGNGVDSSVLALAVIGGDLYVGGRFTTANVGGVPVSANGVAKVNPATGVWSALGAGGSNGVDFSVIALAVIGSDLYVAGDFTTANVGGGPVSANRVAKVNPATGVWSTLADASGGNGVSDQINALAAMGSDLYVGGNFAVAGDNKASVNIGRFCGNSPPAITAGSPLSRQQGSTAGNSTIATVSDNETMAGALIVTTTTVPAGISVTDIANTDGTITANVAAGCGATVGANAVMLTVTDGNGGTATANLTVNVTANTAPVLSYNNQTIPAGGGLTVNPATGPGDNGSVSSIVLQSVGTYTGDIAVNSMTGDITLTNARPGGAHTITVRATDNCGAATDSSFTLNVICPTISVGPASLTHGFQGTAYSQMVTATGGTAPFTFAVTSGALPNGLTLASNGALTGTPATPNTYNFTVTATDSTLCTGTRNYTVIVSGSGLMFYPLPAPVRLLDTRAGTSPNACSQPNAPIPGGTSRTQPARSFCGLPANAQAITGNVTTVNSGGGHLTLFPSDAIQPIVANSNYDPNEIVNNVFTVGLGAGDGAFKIFALNTTDVVVDVTGYYAPPAAGLYFHPLPAPVRLLETRAGFTGCFTPGAPLPDGVDTLQQATGACTGIPAAARAVIGNATTVNPANDGYLTLFPANAIRPLVASSNYDVGQIVNGPFTVGLSPSGEFNIFTTATTDLVIDVLGYYSAEVMDANGVGLLFSPLTHPVRLLETRGNPPSLPGCFKPDAPLNGGQVYTQSARGLCDGLTIPAAALGVVGNATVVGPVAGGHLTLWPSQASQPLAATSNFNAGQVFNRHFIVGLGNADGAFKMFSLATTELVIDLSGYFAP